VKGFVDDGLRALLRVPVSASRDGRRMDVEVWIDTAFNGGLAIPALHVALEDERARHLPAAIVLY